MMYYKMDEEPEINIEELIERYLIEEEQLLIREELDTIEEIDYS